MVIISQMNQVSGQQDISPVCPDLEDFKISPSVTWWQCITQVLIGQILDTIRDASPLMV